MLSTLCKSEEIVCNQDSFMDKNQIFLFCIFSEEKWCFLVFFSFFSLWIFFFFFDFFGGIFQKIWQLIWWYPQGNTALSSCQCQFLKWNILSYSILNKVEVKKTQISIGVYFPSFQQFKYSIFFFVLYTDPVEGYNKKFIGLIKQHATLFNVPSVF